MGITLAVLVVVGEFVGLIGYRVDRFFKGGIWTAQDHLNAFGQPVPNGRFIKENDDTGADLCYSARCSTADRYYRVSGHLGLDEVTRDIVNRLRSQGRGSTQLTYQASSNTWELPLVWSFTCRVDSTSAPALRATMDLSGVDPSQFDLPALHYSKYGGFQDIENVPRPFVNRRSRHSTLQRLDDRPGTGTDRGQGSHSALMIPVLAAVVLPLRPPPLA